MNRRNFIIRIATWLILVGGFGGWSSPAHADPLQTGPKGGTVLIIRHAEKPPLGDASPLLAPLGSERAQKYVEYFKALTFDGGKATPAFVFATAQSKHSNRPWLTVAPLVKSLHLPSDSSLKDEDFAQLGVRLKSGAYDGRTILFAGITERSRRSSIFSVASTGSCSGMTSGRVMFSGG